MTQIDQIITDALAGSPETHVAILAREVVRLREARVVVVPPGDTFTLDLDEFGKSLARITINSKNRGVGYQLCGTMGDGHFSRRTFDITPYLGHCLNLIGIRTTPADRALGDGMVAVDREEWKHIVTLLAHLLCDEDAYEKADSLLEPIAKMREIRDGKAWIGIMVSDALGVSTPEIDDFFACPPSALRANQGGASHD